MRSLFLKIFLWYWAATSAIALVLVATTWTPRDDLGGPLWARDVANLLATHGAALVDVYERQGDAALAEFAARSESSAGVVAYVFDAGGQEILGRAAPERVRNFARLAADADRPRFEQGPEGFAVARSVDGSGGRRYVVAAQFPGDRPGPPPPPGPTFFARIVAVLLTAGIVCYGLARYLTRPVDELRDAARALANGDLARRVGDRMSGRHDEFGDLGRDFDHMASKLSDYVATERRLLQDVSHELRSPLARMAVALELLRRKRRDGNGGGSADRGGGGGEGACEPLLDRLEREAGRLDELIGRTLQLARLDIGGDEQTREAVDLKRVVEAVAADADFEAQSDGKGVDVVRADACETIGDAEALRSAIENVVRNAIRYSPPGGRVDVELRLERAGESAERIDAGGHARAGTWAIVRVRDRGLGVPPEVLERIFRPFYRVADDRGRDSGGTGLGLAIADRAVRAHGGTIRAENAPGGGLAVKMTLPIEAA